MEFTEFAGYFNMMVAMYIAYAIGLYLLFKGFKGLIKRWFK